MKYLSLLLFSMILSSTTHAASKRVVCNVTSLEDATACMQKVADTRPSYEGANEGFASKNTAGLARALTLLGRDKKSTDRAAKANYAGMMFEYGDEFHIYYFTLPNGEDVSPVQLYDLNVVDLEYYLTKPYSAEALSPDTYILGLDEAKESGVYEDITERLGELQ